MHDANGQRFSTLRTNPVEFAGLTGVQSDPTGPMTVQVVFPFFGKEFHGTEVSMAGLEGPLHGKVIQLGIEHAGLTTELGRGMSVGVGDESVAVQGRDTPVHRWIGRKAGLQGEDMFR